VRKLMIVTAAVLLMVLDATPADSADNITVELE
jgi:hypothetical protein